MGTSDSISNARNAFPTTRIVISLAALVLERPPVVDHHGLAAGADQARDQFLHQQRLARPRLARYTDPHADAPPPADMELPGTVKFHDP